MTKAPDDPFTHLWGLGYRRLVPIVPPAANISPNSNLSKNPSARGKAVGVRGHDGQWSGMKDWLAHDATEADIRRWQAMGAGAGVKAGPLEPSRPNGEWLVFIDSDTYDAPLAKQVDILVHEHFGPLPCRVGLYPKALYPIRVSGPVRYSCVRFGELDSNTGRRKHAVEILAGMKQAVFYGVHPRSGEPYRWPRELPPLSALPITTPEKLLAFMEACLRSLPDATTAALQAASSADRAKIDQDGLRGDPNLLEAALEALPNDEAHFPTYDDMTRVGYACKAAFADDPDRGLEAFDKWCAKWEGGGYDPRLVQKWWDSYEGPFQVGAPYIYRTAAALAPEAFNPGKVWFEEIIPTPEDARAQNLQTLFGGSDNSGAEGAAAVKRKLEFITAAASAELATRSRARPLVERLLDCGALSVIYGAPGVGKSFVMLDMAYRIAAGRAHGERRVTQGPVCYVAAEGGGGIHARVKALVDAYGAFDGEGFPVPFYILPDRVNLRDPKADIGPFLEALREVERVAGRIVLVVIDTLARSMGGGDENSPVDMGAMVEHFDKVRSFTGAHVAVVHHTGKDAARGMRGHSSLLGAIDTELEVSEGVVKSEKQRDMESGESFGYRLCSVVVGQDPEGAPVGTARVELVSEDEARAAWEGRLEGGAGAGGALSGDTRLQTEVLGAMIAAWRDIPERHFVDVDEIRARLPAHPKYAPATAESIRVTLNKLKVAGRVVKRGRAEWALAPPKMLESE